nr:integrase, catalytic region, zinc finger, CCHC-type, peptidase aspartic, catalytic [Tanacetum cinerariifolium]
VDVVLLVPKFCKNRTAHIDYIKHTLEETATLREFVESERLLSLLNTPLAYASLVSSANGSQSQDNTKKNRIRRTHKKAKETELEDHPRKVKSRLNKASVVDSRATSSVIKKSKSVKNPAKRKVWKTTGKVFKTVGYIWKPIGRIFTLVGNVYPLTRIATATIVPLREPIPIVKSTDKPVVTLVYTRKPKSKNVPNKMEPNKSWGSSSNVSTSITNCRLSKSSFVKFGNNHVEKIMGYGDYQIGNVTISRVYYVGGLGHNLFSVGQFCDSDLEVAFRQHTCFIRNLKGVDLLT